MQTHKVMLWNCMSSILNAQSKLSWLKVFKHYLEHFLHDQNIFLLSPESKAELLLVLCLCFWHMWSLGDGWGRSSPDYINHLGEMLRAPPAFVSCFLFPINTYFLHSSTYTDNTADCWELNRYIHFFPVQLICCLDTGLTSLCWKGFRCCFH